MKARPTTLREVLDRADRVVVDLHEQSADGVSSATLFVDDWKVFVGEPKHVEHMALTMRRQMRLLALRAYRLGLHAGRAEILALRRREAEQRLAGRKAQRS